MEVRAARRSAVSSTEARGFKVAGREIVLCEVDGEIYALDGICTHEDLPLDGGEIDDGILECPWHGAQYEVCSGTVCALPATRSLATYPVRVDAEGQIFIELLD
ncbi:MAG TPA: non-heme iron oxygenase ferredoxin subunit [Longimicrobiaceae bacterium]|nr:non-heme iron oxygenase ferredoxin subunit [Longimicrobiaceae bacterium]